MMKFDQEKVNFANSDRIESNDLQFLTFRHSAQNNNTGRSVFSQKVQLYKALEKGSNRFDQQQQDEAPVRNFKKASNLRAIRSQEKLLQGKGTKLQQQQERGSEQTTNAQTGLNDYGFRNELLQKKIQKIVKTIMKEQKKEASLQKDISEIQMQLQDDQIEIEKQARRIEEFEAINEENQTNLERLSKYLEDLKRKNENLERLVEKIDNSLQNVGKTSRQEEAKAKMAQKLKEGIVKLQTLKAQTANRCARMETEIQKMKQYIEQTQNLDFTIRDTTYTREAENNSHFTC